MAWLQKRGVTPDGRNRYLVQWRDPSRKHRGETVIGREEALNLKRDVEDALAGRTPYVDRRAGRVQLKNYAARWMATRAHLRPKTVSRYGQLLRAHILPALGDMPVNGIGSSDVESLVASMIARGSAPQTVRNTVFVLSGILRTAARDGLVARVPTDDIRFPRAHRADQRYLAPDDLATLAAAEPIAPQWTVMVLLGGYSGLRFGELAGLKVEALRLLERKVDVVWQVGEDGNRLVEGPPKWGSDRAVTIPRFVAEALGAHLEPGARLAALLGTSPPGPSRAAHPSRGSPGRRCSRSRGVGVAQPFGYGLDWGALGEQESGARGRGSVAAAPSFR